MTDELGFADVERAARDRDPQLGDVLVRFLAQPDPAPGALTADELAALAEPAPDADADADATGDDPPPPLVPAGAWTLERVRFTVGPIGLRDKTAGERKAARLDAFANAVSSRFAPPRLRLGALLLALDDAGDDAARAALVQVFAEGQLGWGSWQAFKQIWKRAEARHDALLVGVCAYRLDAMRATPYRSDEIGAATVHYLRTRAWRYLRLLGAATPEAYPAFAVEVLRHYPARHRGETWVAGHVWWHERITGNSTRSFAAPAGDAALADAAYPDSWKLSPAPLLRLLDAAGNEIVCGWAIAALRAAHPMALRSIEPGWLARLGRRPLAVLHGFVAAILRESPELHQSKLRALGLHDMVLGLLRSPDTSARTYALEYARAHAPDLGVDALLELATVEHADTVGFALSRLEPMAPAAIGLAGLVRLLAVTSAAEMAVQKLKAGFSPKDVDLATFIELAGKHDKFLVDFYNSAKVGIPSSHWTGLIDDPRCDARTRRWALTELGKRDGASIGAVWLMKAAEDRTLGATVGPWLTAGKLAGDALDVEWVKRLVLRPRLRALGVSLLGNRAQIAPSRIGLDWLLEQARSPEPAVHDVAHRLLLEHFAPEDFAPGGFEAGLARLWELAVARAEPVRAFASTYLRAHHPDLGPALPEARALRLTPRLGHEHYTAARVVPLCDDPRADVRRLAVAIVAEEVVRWADAGLPYRLAWSAHREPRGLGGELLLSLAPGDVAVAPTRALPTDWLDGARLFALAEAPHKASREVALTLIRRAYDRVGGATRLASLMESPERDVRLFAVRLFWDRHRPRPLPDGFVPRKPIGLPVGSVRFADTAAVRDFLRTVLFGVPPGRLEQRDAPEGVRPDRPLSASVAKRRLIEAVRDLALADAEFAAVIAPVLEEMSHSVAKGEWQACVAALAMMRQP